MPPLAQQPDHRTMAPARRAAATASRATVVFPMPASPSTSTNRPAPSAAIANASVRAAPAAALAGSTVVGHDDETVLGTWRRQPRSGASPATPDEEADMTTTTTEPPAIDDAVIGDFAGRVALAAIAGFELTAMELGRRLGLYDALAEGRHHPAGGGRTQAGIDARYAREWLEQQATAGVVRIDAEPVDGDPDTRRFSLPAEHQVCLLDAESLAFVDPAGHLQRRAGTRPLPSSRTAYRTGYRHQLRRLRARWIRHAQEALNRPAVRRPAGIGVAPYHARRRGRLETAGARRGRCRLRLRLVVDRNRPRLPEHVRARHRQRRRLRR